MNGGCKCKSCIVNSFYAVCIQRSEFAVVGKRCDHRGVGGVRRIALLVAIVALIGGCSSTAPAPSPSASAGAPSATPALPTTSPPPTAPAVTALLSGSPSASVATPAEAPLPPLGSTAWERELRNVNPDGTRTLESALRLFAIAFGPLPGVQAPADGRLVDDGTLAVRAVLAHDRELTPEQRAAIAKAIAPPDGAFHITVDPGQAWIAGSAALRSDVFMPAFEPPPDVQARLVQESHNIRSFYAGKLGEIPGLIEIFLSGDRPEPQPGLLLLGQSHPIYDNAGKYAGCTLVITGNATDLGDAAALRTMSHEIFHCFESSIVPRSDWDPMPDWIMEGAADWAADQIHPYPPKNARWWQHYLTEPLTPLFWRSYDAIGFYAHLAETGIDPWTVFRAMWTSGIDSATVFKASGADNKAFTDSWASGLLRESSRGRAWDTQEISISADQVIAPPADMGDGGNFTIHVDPYTNWDETLNVSAHYLGVTTTGSARLSDGSIDLVLPAHSAFCTDQAACESTCPDGTAMVPAPAKLGSASVIAITGGTQGSDLAAVGLNLDAFCKPRPSPVQSAAWVYLDEFGLRIDIVACKGPFGSWSGTLRYGSIPGSNTGYLPDPKQPYLDLLIAFTVSGTTARATVTGTKTIGGVAWKVAFDLTFAFDPSGDRASITGKDTVTIGTLPTSAPLSYPDVPIQPAPAGRCP